MWWALLAVQCLAQSGAPATGPDAGLDAGGPWPAPVPRTPSADTVTSDAGALGPFRVWGGVEVAGAGFPVASDEALTGLEGYLVARPVLGFAAGADFVLALAPTFRLRMWPFPGTPEAQGRGSVLRAQDWDTPSDYGQLLQHLEIARESNVVHIKAGAVRKKTLGHGHLLSRYSNQENPDYHPAHASLVLTTGPVRTELLTSDILGARVLAGELDWDVGGTFSAVPEVAGRYRVAVSLAHDFAIAGMPRLSVTQLICDVGPCDLDARNFIARTQLTLLHLDGSAVLLRTPAVSLQVLAGFGNRFAPGAPDVGFLLGGAADVTVGEVGLSAKLEARKQNGGFRQGMLGPAYELSRLAGTGLSGIPLAQERLPDAFSFYAEARAGVGGVASLDAAVEAYTWGRTDLDVTGQVQLLAGWLSGEARFTVVGLGQLPRFAVSAGLKARVLKSFYVLGSGGTVFLPLMDGLLGRGITASLGAGVDFER